MSNKKRDARVATYVDDAAARWAERQDPLMRLAEMESAGRSALANRNARLFHPLVHAMDSLGRAVWRTPRAYDRPASPSPTQE